MVGYRQLKDRGSFMERSSAQKIAAVLKILVTITFVCNLIAIPLVPYVARMRYLTAYAGLDDPEHAWISSTASMVLIAFLVFCGINTAVILWQGRRVLGTILTGEPFCEENGRSLRRAAACAFLISGAALLRTLWGVWFYANLRPLATYNALFVPLFAMGGLLLLVMSALFRRAAELKAEQDLTI